MMCIGVLEFVTVFEQLEDIVSVSLVSLVGLGSRGGLMKS